jgi:hypothetical protein
MYNVIYCFLFGHDIDMRDFKGVRDLDGSICGVAHMCKKCKYYVEFV